MQIIEFFGSRTGGAKIGISFISPRGRCFGNLGPAILVDVPFINAGANDEGCGTFGIIIEDTDGSVLCGRDGACSDSFTRLTINDCIAKDYFGLAISIDVKNHRIIIFTGWIVMIIHGSNQIILPH